MTALELVADERLFYDSVYQFADREVGPLVRGMDERAKIPHELIESCARSASWVSRFPRSTTAPARASSMTSWPSRRYLGSIRQSASWSTSRIASASMRCCAGGPTIRNGD
jgi:hypothetical protein